MILRVLWILILGGSAFAKFVQDESAPGLTLSYRRTYDIQKNYQYKSTTEQTNKIIDENSLSKDAVRVITFNPKLLNTKIIKATVTNDGITEEVRPDQIVLKDADPETSNSFDSQKSYVINFTGAKVGSILYLKIEQDTLPSEGDASFYYFGYSVQVYANEWNISIRSEVPLHRYIKNDNGQFEFTSDFKDGRYLYTANSKKPFRYYITGEDNVYDRTERFPFFYFSSHKDWRNFIPKLREKYNQIKKQELPPKLKAAVEAIPANLSAYEKAFRLVKSVVPNYRYFSDMRRINGELIPRSLKEIEVSGYADCKDISSYLAAALTKMGIVNNVALIWRGTNDVPEDSAFELAMDANFNHAVLRAELDGKEYWIDGTNRIVYFDVPHPDIAGRNALLIEENGMTLTKVPEFRSNASRYEEEINYDFNRDSKFVRMVSKQKNKGYIAYQTMRDDLSMQESLRDFFLVRSVTGVATYKNPKVQVNTDGFDLKKQIDIQLEAEIENVGFRTSSGLGFTLPQSGRLGKFIFNIAERDGDLALGFPTELHLLTRLNKKKRVGTENLNCNISSPWLDFKRKIQSKSKGTEIVDELKTKVPFISNDQIKSSQFLEVQNEIIRCQNSALILKDM